MQTAVSEDAGGVGGRTGPADVVLWAAVLALALLRFLWLGEWGLWIDEAHTLHDALAASAASSSYPLGYWLTRLSVWASGGRIDEATLRFAPALFGALALPLSVWAFAPFIGRRRALVTALLLGSSAWHMYWSQSARAYTLALLLSLAGAGYYLRGLIAGRRRALQLGFLLGVVAIFAHPSAALLLATWVLAPVALVPLGVKLGVGGSRRTWILGGVLLALVVGVWGVRVLEDYRDAKASADWLASWRHLALSMGFYVTPWLAGGALLGALSAHGRKEPCARLASAVIALLFLAALVLACFVRVSAQYLYMGLPWIAALATVPLERRARGPLAWLYLGLLVLPGLVDSGLYFGPRHGDRPRWREAFAHVFAERAPHDLVFGMAAVVGQYYLDPGSVSLREHRDLVRLNSYTSFEPGRWARRGRRTWFVVRREELGDWPSAERAVFEALLAEECRRTLVLPVRYTPRDLTVEVYVREPWAAGGGPHGP